jgi:hypothetical protein
LAKDQSPFEIIESGSWSEALFLTYALSLSFFESVLLPPLRRAGCSKITIYADRRGYRASLVERQSLAAVQDRARPDRKEESQHVAAAGPERRSARFIGSSLQ